MEETKPNKTVLIVEDDKSMQQALTDALVSVGFGVKKADDGEKGLAVAKMEHPDLILIDILMPKMNGLEMMKNLREDMWGKNVPIILLTNVNPDSSEVLQSVVDNQPAYYLIKSDNSLEAVIAKVKEVLNVK